MNRCASYGLGVMVFSLLLSASASAATLARQCGAVGIFTYDSIPTATQTTDVPVPYAWLRTHDPSVVDEYEAYEAAAKKTAANGWKVWECYVLDLDPQEASSDFRIASFPMKADGTPDLANVTFDPPQEQWNVPEAPVVWKGAAQLEGPWRTVTAEGGSPGMVRPTMRFFKAVVFGNADDDPDDAHDGVQLWECGPYWATKNVGAEEPWECGYYFWWGDTVGYARSEGTWTDYGSDEGYYDGVTWVSSTGEQMSSDPFTPSLCPTYGKNNAALLSAGYIDSTGNLVAAHDAATVHLGLPWRMPTSDEIVALVNNCTTTWITTNGVSGRLVTGKGDYANRSIFLPAAGYGDAFSNLHYPNSLGIVWSSTPDSSRSNYAWDLRFRSSSFGRSSNSRRDGGQCVRPVRDDGGTVNMYTYMVTYKPGANGSGVQQTATKTHGVALALKGAIFTRSGYTQTGWSTSDGGSKAYDLNASYTSNAAITLYPYWTAHSGTDTHDSVQLWEGGPYWATTNIGAEKPEDYGYYFWWGDTVGYKREGDAWVASDGSSRNFEFYGENTPAYDKSIDKLKSEGWITMDGILAPEHDAAQVHWGGDWRMPTKQEESDLNSKCDWTWTAMNGVMGYVVRGRGGYSSASIFLPAAGYGYGTSLHLAGSSGNYWSSVPDSDNDYGYSYSWCLDFYSGYHGTYYNCRYYGWPIRPVQGFTE